MIRIFRQRRSQIRGVDFTVAMIFFMLTMMNVLVVTNNLISDTASVARNENQNDMISRTIKSLISTQGTTNWESIPTSTLSSLNWSIGLQSETDSGLDQFKLSRLKITNIAEYALTYEEIGKRLSSQGKAYQLEIFSPLNNSILTVVPVGNNLQIVGAVDLNGNPVSNANVTIHLIKMTTSGNATVQTIRTSTNSTGFYDYTVIGILPANFIGAISFADYFGTLQDTSFASYVPGGSSFARTNSTILSDDVSNSNIAKLNVKKEAGNTLSQAWVLYPAESSGQVNFTELSSFNSTPATFTSIPNIALPAEGSVALFTLQNSSFSNGFYSIDFLPTYLDGDNDNFLQPSQPLNALSSTSTVSVIVRSLIVYIRMSVWEVEI